MKKHALWFLPLTGCLFSPTPYQPSGWTGGYTDYAAGRGVYYVAFNGNGYTSRGSVTAMWHRRAAELCGGEDRYDVVARDGNSVTEGETITFTKHSAEGYVRCVDGEGNIVAAPPTKEKKPKESALVQPEEPSWNEPEPVCEMRGDRQHCD
jgi:hypothetical protein